MEDYKEARIDGLEDNIKYIDRETSIGNIPVTEREILEPLLLDVDISSTREECFKAKEDFHKIMNFLTDGRLLSPCSAKHSLFGDHTLSKWDGWMERIDRLDFYFGEDDVPKIEMGEEEYQKLSNELKGVRRGNPWKETLNEDFLNTLVTDYSDKRWEMELKEKLNKRKAFAKRIYGEFILNPEQILKEPLAGFFESKLGYDKKLTKWLDVLYHDIWSSKKPTFVFGNQNPRFRKFVERRFQGRFEEAKIQLDRHVQNSTYYPIALSSLKDEIAVSNSEVNTLALYLGYPHTKKVTECGSSILTYDTNTNYLTFRDAEIMIDPGINCLNGSRKSNPKIIYFK